MRVAAQSAITNGAGTCSKRSAKPSWRLRRQLLLSAAEPDHAAATIPKLYVMTVNQALGFDSGLDIVMAAQRHTPYDVPIRVKDIGPIFQQRATEMRGV
jgi:hypothetical protein